MRKNKLSKNNCVVFLKFLQEAQMEVIKHAVNGFPENDGYIKSDAHLCVKLLELGDFIDAKVRKKETE